MQLVQQEPSVREKGTRLLLLVMTVSIPSVIPLPVKSAKRGSSAREELKEIVHLEKSVVEGLHLIVILVTTQTVEGAPVNHATLGSTTPRGKLRAKMTVPLVLST